MDQLYDNSAEANAHAGAIESLVAEMHLPPDVVRDAYEHELDRLKPGARVKDYLLLFTVRNTREILRRRRRG